MEGEDQMSSLGFVLLLGEVLGLLLAPEVSRLSSLPGGSWQAPRSLWRVEWFFFFFSFPANREQVWSEQLLEGAVGT